mgnify:CR=1 FL=1
MLDVAPNTKIDNNNTGLSHHINSNTRCCRVNRIVENYIATLCNKIFDNTLLISSLSKLQPS